MRGAAAYNRAYLALADISAQIARFARDFRYAQRLGELAAEKLNKRRNDYGLH
jgi:hypothetical protein